MTGSKENGDRDRIPVGPRRSLSRATTDTFRRVMAATRRAELGRVARLFLDGGFGFVRTHDGVVAYFAAEDVSDGGFTALTIGARVRFDLEGDGTPHAVDIALA